MKPYYQDENIIIYHGNCGEILLRIPNADLVLTDPPYGINFQSNWRFKKYDKIKNDESLPIDLINLCISKANNAAYIFGRWNKFCEMPFPKSLLVWIKNNHSMGDLKHEHGRAWEACFFYPKENHEFIKRTEDLLFAPITQNFYHPTEKPAQIWQQLIQANKGDSILDPFMGSGSTLIAAKNLGKKAIGIEIEEKYCEITVKRLRQGVLF